MVALVQPYLGLKTILGHQSVFIVFFSFLWKFSYCLCRLPFPYFTKVPSLWYLWLRHWYVKDIRMKIKSVPWMPYYILKAYLEGVRHSLRPLTNQYGAMRYLRRRVENRGMLGKTPRDKWLHTNLFHPPLHSRTNPSISCHSLHKSAVHCSLNWTLDSKKIVFKVGDIMGHITIFLYHRICAAQFKTINKLLNCIVKLCCSLVFT